MPRLSKEDRDRAICMLQVGRPKRQVAQRFGCTVRTIHRVWHRFNQTGSTSDRPRSGRLRVTTLREERYIRLSHLRDRFLCATVTARTFPGRSISAQTVRLKSSRLRARRPYTGPVLTRRHRASHLNWARAHCRWLLRQWNNVMFSDASRFCLTHGDGRQRVWRRRGERYVGC